MTFARMTEDELSMHFNGVRCCLEVLTLSRVLPPSSFLCFYFVTFTFILHHVLHTATTRYSWAQRYLYLRLNTNLFEVRHHVVKSSCHHVVVRSDIRQTSDRRTIAPHLSPQQSTIVVLPIPGHGSTAWIYVDLNATRSRTPKAIYLGKDLFRRTCLRRPRRASSGRGAYSPNTSPTLRFLRPSRRCRCMRSRWCRRRVPARVSHSTGTG